MTSEAAGEQSAGGVLRAARERRGMTLASLAAALKVAPRKLDALENDRLDELPDLTFARALARQVARTLGIDAEPVLALLPSATAAGARLEHVAGARAALGGPDERRRAPASGGGIGWPALALAGLLLLAAVLLYGWPYDLSGLRQALPARADASPTAGGSILAAASQPAAAPEQVASQPAAASVADAAASAPVEASGDAVAPGGSLLGTGAAQVAAAASAPVVETVHSAPRGADAASSPDADTPAGALVLRASDESWVEVRDASGQVLLSRTLQAGEAVGVDGALPLRAVIGNAAGTSVTLRGVAVDVAAATRDNVARLELK